ncbi:MAG: DUF4150 domain-containing protein [Polyangiaceae bacterium]
MPAPSLTSGCSVTVNDRTVVHRTSAGTVQGFPDVCFTPDRHGPPVAYTNYAHSMDAQACCDSIFCDGQHVMKLTSFLSPSYGDEAGLGGGISSGCCQGKATFPWGSDSVKFEGEEAPRHLDIMGANHMSPPNIHGLLLQLIIKVSIGELLCIAFCACNDKGLKSDCFRPKFADLLYTSGPTPYYDPRFPGVWLEVPYDMSTKPPTMISSDVDSSYQKTKTEKGKPGNR